jgi:hypothetical protein
VLCDIYLEKAYANEVRNARQSICTDLDILPHDLLVMVVYSRNLYAILAPFIGDTENPAHALSITLLHWSTLNTGGDDADDGGGG